MTPGEKIKALREAMGLTQEDLAAALQRKYRGCNITRYMIANWERNRHEPHWPTAKILVQFFNITLDDLFFENRNPLKAFKPVKNKLRAA
jgi:transcriptional regulator with XRE-family HTH domain